MQQRQVLPDSGHHADARIRIAEAGVDVHAADEGAAHGLLISGCEAPVALAGRGRLLAPRGEGMAGGGHDAGAVRFRRLDDQAPGLAQRLAHLGHRAADARVGLDLGAQELVHHLVRPARLLAGRRRCPRRDRSSRSRVSGSTRKNSSSTPSVMARSSASAPLKVPPPLVRQADVPVRFAGRAPAHDILYFLLFEPVRRAPQSRM